MAQAPVAFRYAWPAPALRGGVFVYWEVTIGTGTPPVDLLLPYWATMRFPIAGDWLHGETHQHIGPVPPGPLFHGLTNRATWIGGSGGSVFCIVLFPMFWASRPGLSASDFANKVTGLSAVLGEDAARLGDALKGCAGFEERVRAADIWLDDFFERNPPSSRDRRAGMLMQALNDPEADSVANLCARLGLSQTQLSRIAMRCYGFTPKLLIRRERFLRMLFTMERRPYAEWPDFIDAQYVDQSHMIRDFKDFTGLTPGQYFALERPILSVAAEAIKHFLAGEAEPASTAIRRIREDG